MAIGSRHFEPWSKRCPRVVPKRETAKLVRRLEQDFDLESFLGSPDVATILPSATSGSEAVVSATRLRDWLAELVRVQESLARRWGLFVYPAILFAMTAALLIGFSFFLIPTFREMYEDFGLVLPAPTLWVFWAADQISNYLPRTVLLAAVAILLAIPLIRALCKKALTNRILGRLYAGSSSNLRCMSTLTRTLAELLDLSGHFQMPSGWRGVPVEIFTSSERPTNCRTLLHKEIRCAGGAH